MMSLLSCGSEIMRLARRLFDKVDHASIVHLVFWSGAGLAGLILAAYLPVFTRWFVRDDFLLLSLAKYDWSLQRPLTFLTETHNGLFTPLSNFLFWLAYQVFSLNAGGYRALLIFNHWLNAALLGTLIYLFERNRTHALAGALVFAVTFSVQEAVGWIAAYNHLLALTVLLLALLASGHWIQTGRGRYLGLSLLALAVGILVKEDTLTFPVLLLLLIGLAWKMGSIDRRSFLLAGGLYLLLGLVQFAVVLLWHRSAPSLVAGGQVAIGLHGLANYRALVGLLIPPPDYIPFVSLVSRLLPGAFLTIYQVIGWGLLVPLAAFLAWRFWKGSLLERVASALVLVTFAPFSMVTVGISLRYLYLPYAGFAILLGWGAAQLRQSRREVLLLAALVIFVTGSLLGTWVWNLRVGRYTDEKRAAIQTIQRDYDAGRIAQKQICVVGLPVAISDVTIGVPVFTERSPRPEVYMDAYFCPPGSFEYEYVDGVLVIR